MWPKHKSFGGHQQSKQQQQQPSWSSGKKHKKQRGAEVVYNEQDHIDYVTGFGKRKKQRREQAQQELKLKAKQVKKEEKKEQMKMVMEQRRLMNQANRRTGEEEEREGGEELDDGKPRSFEPETEEVDVIQQSVYQSGDGRGIVTATVSALDPAWNVPIVKLNETKEHPRKVVAVKSGQRKKMAQEQLKKPKKELKKSQRSVKSAASFTFHRRQS